MNAKLTKERMIIYAKLFFFREVTGKSIPLFREGPSDAEQSLVDNEEQIAELERKVGQLTIEVDWLKKVRVECAREGLPSSQPSPGVRPNVIIYF